MGTAEDPASEYRSPPRHGRSRAGFPAYEPSSGADPTEAPTEPEAAVAGEDTEAPGSGGGPSGASVSSPGSPPSEESLASKIPQDDMRRAVVGILQGWRDDTEEEEPGRQTELTHQLVTVAEAVTDVRAGREFENPEDGLVLRRRLLELFRGELVATWSRHEELRPDADEMVRTLEALETVQAALSPKWDERFAVDLAGPSGLELAVEVAHDFRSPLSSILFLADILREGGSGEVSELQERQLGLIYAAALSMVSMASDVVDLGQTGRRIADREPSQFSISEVMESVRGIVEPMAEAKGLSLAVRPPQGDVRQGDPEALRRVLLNLTTNAVKFTSEGFVEISARSQGPQRVQFSVRDTGPGIREGIQQGLYRPFRPFQGRSGFHFSGTGLGLTIARKLVRAMEGELDFETQKNLGTRFHFTIPLPRVDGF